MLKILGISVEKIKNNKLADELPELYQLKDVIENNIWHKGYSVFDHTVFVLENLEEILASASDYINSYLNNKIGKCNRKQLLFLGALFHDIGKKETLVKNNGVTSCPRHEKVGSAKTAKILDMFGLNEEEKKTVTQIVKYHGYADDIIDSKNNKLKEQYEEFKAKHSNIFLELVLLSMADTSGCHQFKDIFPDDFDFKMVIMHF